MKSLSRVSLAVAVFGLGLLGLRSESQATSIHFNSYSSPWGYSGPSNPWDYTPDNPWSIFHISTQYKGGSNLSWNSPQNAGGNHPSPFDNLPDPWKHYLQTKYKFPTDLYCPPPPSPVPLPGVLPVMVLIVGAGGVLFRKRRSQNLDQDLEMQAGQAAV